VLYDIAQSNFERRADDLANLGRRIEKLDIYANVRGSVVYVDECKVGTTPLSQRCPASLKAFKGDSALAGRCSPSGCRRSPARPGRSPIGPGARRPSTLLCTQEDGSLRALRLEDSMHSKATALSGWEDDDGDAFETERVVAVVEDGFERGVALDGMWLCVRSRELRSGSVTAVCSGVTVDLRGALLSPEGATIHVQSALSGIEVLVPADWEVACEVDAIWSGVSEQRPGASAAEARPRLRIVGMVVAGGLSVR
jgi:hypothetical protein